MHALTSQQTSMSGPDFAYRQLQFEDAIFICKGMGGGADCVHASVRVCERDGWGREVNFFVVIFF